MIEKPYGVRIDYVHEQGTWWAYANLNFSAANDTLAALKHQVHTALEEILGPDLEYVEVVREAEHRPTTIITPWTDPNTP
jgi:hypothetical protein